MSAATTFLIPQEPTFAWRYFSAGGATDPVGGPATTSERHLFFWARNALFAALHAFAVPKPGRVLAPAYICKAAVEPFEAYGLAVDFFRVGRDCLVDLNDLARRIQPNTRVVLVAHYFGFPQNIAEIRALCSNKNLLLFEDCAHVLRGGVSGQPPGASGDASVFSYRKFLPMFDGGELLLGKAGHTGPLVNAQSRFAARAAKYIVSYALDSSPSFSAACMKGLIATAKRLTAKTPASLEPSPAGFDVDNKSVAFDLRLANEPITPASRWVLRHSDVPGIVARRRQNFLMLLELLTHTPGIAPLHQDLPQSACPWVFPLVMEGVPDAHLALRRKGIPAVTWGGVRPDNVCPSEFSDADFLYDNLVFLPIHQNLTDEQIRLTAKVVHQVRAEAQHAAAAVVPMAS